MAGSEGGITFPLSERYLPTLALTRQEIVGYRAAANEIVAKTLEQEIDFRTTQMGELDQTKWKLLKGKDHLKVYKRIVPASSTRGARSRFHLHRTPSASSTTSSHDARNDGRTESNAAETAPTQGAVPMLVALGKIEGRMEDALYGVHHKNTDEMRITTSFINKHHLDAAVLHTIDSGTDADPFRYLGIKWRIAETPGGSLISNRDVCVLEFVGTSVDAQGQRFGFHVIKSIDAPWFPELPDPHIVRARMMLCCIYRQLQPTVVDCYMKGVYDLGGDLIDLISYNTAADILLAIAKTVDCAEAKKLTLRLILEQKRRLKTFTRPGSARSVAGADTYSVDRSATGISTDDDDDHGGEDDRFGHDDICSVCHKKRSTLSKIGSKWDRCRICRGATCSKCHVRKTIFARPKHIKVPCCKPCILEAKELHVDPRDPYPVIGNMVNDSS